MQGPNQSANFWDFRVRDQIKIHQILVSFEATNQFFFKFCITRQCHETQLLCTFLAEILYTFNKRSLSRYKFGETEILKSGTLMDSLRQNNINFHLKKYRGVISHERSLKKKWLTVLNRAWRILWIFTQPPKVPKFYFNMLFLSKVYEVWAKKYGGVIFHDIEQWCKFWINPDFVVLKMAWGIGWTFITALKNLKNCILMGSFCPKDICFS